MVPELEYLELPLITLSTETQLNHLTENFRL